MFKCTWRMVGLLVVMRKILLLYLCIIPLREKLFRLSYDQWSLVDEHIQEQMARMAAASAWGLREWDAMDEYIQKIPIDTVEGAFYRAVHATETEKYETAKQVCLTVDVHMLPVPLW